MASTSPTAPGSALPPPDRVRQDRALFERYLDTRDPAARDALVERFLPLARQLARRYQRAEEPFDDLLQVACLGPRQGDRPLRPRPRDRVLELRGARRSSASSGATSATAPGRCACRATCRSSRCKVDRAVAELSRDLSRPPTVAEIAEPLGATRSRCSRRSRPRRLPRDVARRARASATTTRATRSATRSAPTSTASALAEHRATLDAPAPSLTPREREVLRLRFEEDLTQAEIGDADRRHPDAGLADHPPDARPAARRRRAAVVTTMAPS